MNDSFSPVYENKPIGTTSLPATFSYRTNSSASQGSMFNWHKSIEIYYVVEGSLTLNTNGQFYKINTGDIGIISWGLPHRGFDFEDNTKHYIIQVDVSSIPQLSVYSELQMPYPLANIVIHNNQKAKATLDEAILYNKSNKIGSELNTIASLLNFFALILQINSENNSSIKNTNTESLDHVHQLMQYINTHFREHITLDILSISLGLSKAYMCRLFKKYIGQTIIHYLNEQRCNYALSLITSGVTLQEAALMSGFTDYNYFSRVFNQVMGRRPSIKK